MAKRVPSAENARKVTGVGGLSLQMLLHAELLAPSAVSPMLKVTGESEYLHICTTFRIKVIL